MHRSHSTPLVSLVIAVVLLLIAAAPAPASGPASVTVRVEGLNETKLAATQVTTTTALVVKDGKPADACPGTNAAGALDLATGGSWGGTWFGGKVEEGKFKGLGYSVETILGETWTFSSGSFWNFWVDNKAQEEGVCERELQPGDQVLLYPCHFEEGHECPNPLVLEAPSSVGVGEPVPVTVKRYAANGSATPAGGATIAGAATPALTDAAGHATLTLSHAGAATLVATAPSAVRAEAPVCAHSGNDGNCGTTAPASGGGPVVASGGQTASPPPYKGPFAVVARPTGVLDGHVYLRRNAPRVLAGLAAAHTAISSVSIELWRQYRGRCYSYEGARERFTPARCAHGSFFKIPSASSFFKVSSMSSFSYLLPFALGRGEYVMDIEATDAVGNRTTLARGTSRIRFYVR
ncbi:MAG TPA: hypothetical protein VNZ01_14445 [Solirubrobacteraceae bacterium]|jgi:hypothetical protein|nr:hypothetical protein [Solirubrobacteraceae bacterium]